MSDFQSIRPNVSHMRLCINSQCDCAIDHNGDMERIGDKIRALREAGSRRLSQKALAKAAGVSQTTIADLERGRNDSSTRLTAIASALGVTAEQLEAMSTADLLVISESPSDHVTVYELKGRQAPLLSYTQTAAREARYASENTEPGPAIKGAVPLISWVQAGAWSEIVDNFAPNDAEEWLPCPVAHSDKTFVLKVRGESMFNPYGRPSFQDGDLIFVDPERQANQGSLIVVRLEDTKEATFKKLVIEGPRRYLKALNPGWPEPMIEINGNATICGVVVFKGERLC